MSDRASLSTPMRQARQSRPELAVVVIGLGAPPELIEAVRSIDEQAVPIEVVVVNSGGGDAPGLFARAGIDVPVFETQERLFVGAARNIGIRQTTAPYVAFLASDCLATPGWAAERLRLHRSGAPMVASAVMPFPPDHLVSWAHHLLLFPHRLPGLAAVEALRYGVSFDRKVFGEYGVFDGGLATGEDTEFLDRMRASAEPAWTSTVVTLHRNVTTGPALLRDQLVRGYRYGHAMHQLRGYSRLMLAKLALSQPRRSKRLAMAGACPGEISKWRWRRCGGCASAVWPRHWEYWRRRLPQLPPAGSARQVRDRLDNDRRRRSSTGAPSSTGSITKPAGSKSALDEALRSRHPGIDALLRGRSVQHADPQATASLLSPGNIKPAGDGRKK